MKIEYDVDAVLFEVQMNEYMDQKDPKIFSCKLKMKLVDPTMPEIIVWSGKLNFVEMFKVWLVAGNQTSALLMMKDDSSAISSMATAMTKKFSAEWPQIKLAGTPVFHDYVAARNLLIDHIIKTGLDKAENNKTDTSEVVPESN